MPLVMAANRDEFHGRPTAPADFWPTQPDVLGGRDLQAGGGWIALHRAGRLAAVTNHRDGAGMSAKRSRGQLVSDFVAGNRDAAAHLDGLHATRMEYGGFNLLLYDRFGMHYFSNRTAKRGTIAAGIHGMSNGLLDTPWPKVEAGKRRLRDLLGLPTDVLVQALFHLLADRSVALDSALPSTGVSHEQERMLSSAFILSPDYGTRASTVILLHANGRLDFAERSFDADGALTGERHYQLTGFDAAS